MLKLDFLLIGCDLNGQHVAEGREVSLNEDPCLKCSCLSSDIGDKRLTCAKRACPILQCPILKQIRPPGECCHRCAEKRPSTHQFPGKCVLGKGFHADGKQFMVDNCPTKCTCTNGTSVCRRKTCPVLECATEYQTMGEDCCLHCPTLAQVKSTCTYNGTEYQVGANRRVSKQNVNIFLYLLIIAVKCDMGVGFVQIVYVYFKW